jgi:inner membrane protease subunit 2
MAINHFISNLRSVPIRPYLRKTGYNLLIFASWVPAVIFFNENVGETTKINGASMYPYLNTSYNESRKKDLCWVNKWNPGVGLERGMLISFWYETETVKSIQLTV